MNSPIVPFHHEWRSVAERGLRRLGVGVGCVLLTTAVAVAQPAPSIEILTTLDGAAAARPPVAGEGSSSAYLRVFWASPPLPNIGPVFDADDPIDIYAGSSLLRRDLGPGELTVYQPVPAGALDFGVHCNGPSRAEHSQRMFLESGGYYTVVLEGYTEQIRIFQFDDAREVSGTPRLRVVRILPAAPPLEVELIDKRDPIYRDVLSGSGDSTSYLPVTTEVGVDVLESGIRRALAKTEVRGLADGASATVWLIEPRGNQLAENDELLLGDGRFALTATWVAGERSGIGRGVPLTSDTGAFWFFNDQNYELMVKVLDGRDVNGNFWVFYGSLSNVEFRLDVRDRVTGRRVTYLNPAGTFRSRGDVDALLP